jgi:hypothetical protein
MNAPSEAQKKAYQLVVYWYIQRPKNERDLSEDSLISLRELLLHTWQQAQASMVEQMRFHKTGETTVIVIGPTPFNVETLPGGDKNE